MKMDEFYRIKHSKRKKDSLYPDMKRLLPVPPDLFPGPRLPQAQPAVPLFDMNADNFQG